MTVSDCDEASTDGGARLRGDLRNGLSQVVHGDIRAPARVRGLLLCSHAPRDHQRHGCGDDKRQHFHEHFPRKRNDIRSHPNDWLSGPFFQPSLHITERMRIRAIWALEDWLLAVETGETGRVDIDRSINFETEVGAIELQQTHVASPLKRQRRLNQGRNSRCG
jgi:hypothetical protein